MRTLFETGWRRDGWSSNFSLGQAAATGNIFGDIASSAGEAVTSYYQAQKAEEERKAAEAKAAADAARAQASAAAAAAAGGMAPNKILGMSPTTAAIVGVAGLAAIIGVVMLTKKK